MTKTLRKGHASVCQPMFNNKNFQSFILCCVHYPGSKTVWRQVISVMVVANVLYQCCPTTFDPWAILQKYDNSRATFNKMMYERTDSQYLKLKKGR